MECSGLAGPDHNFEKLKKKNLISIDMCEKMLDQTLICRFWIEGPILIFKTGAYPTILLWDSVKENHVIHLLLLPMSSLVLTGRWW